MIKKHHTELPFDFLDCIRQTRQHYLHHLQLKLQEYQLMIDNHNLNTNSEEELWQITTDFEKHKSLINKLIPSSLICHDVLIPKVCRTDIVILNGSNVVEESLCWPVSYDVLTDKYIEDIVSFRPQKFLFDTTIIEINPFPWFNCTIEIYPNATPVMGLLDLWFLKWYYSMDLFHPFLGVVHRMDKHGQDDSKEIFQFDLGSAPVHAMTELISLMCRKGISKINIM